MTIMITVYSYVYVKGSAEALRVSRLIQSRARELLIIMTGTPLRRRRRYAITFSHYRGVLGNDLRGLYRSTYRDERGHQLYVFTRSHLCMMMIMTTTTIMIITISSGQRILTKGRIVVLSPIRAVKWIRSTFPPSNKWFLGPT